MKECYTSTAHTVEIVSSSHRFPSFFFLFTLYKFFSFQCTWTRNIKKGCRKENRKKFFHRFPYPSPLPSISLFHGKGTLNINTREREREERINGQSVLSLREISDCSPCRKVRSFVDTLRPGGIKKLNLSNLRRGSCLFYDSATNHFANCAAKMRLLYDSTMRKTKQEGGQNVLYRSRVLSNEYLS